MAPKIAIVYYSMYGHIKQLAMAEAKGIKEAGGSVDMYQIPETLPAEVLQKMYAAPKDTSITTIDDPKVLEQYDGVLFGIPTRYGNFPAQWKAFLDKTGGQWQSGAFWGKYAGLFVSTGTQGGGQESTAIAAMSTLVHHGFIYVPLGYKTTFALWRICPRSVAAALGALGLSPQETAPVNRAQRSSNSQRSKVMLSTRPLPRSTSRD
ncbi:flavodoxin-like fold protein [Friedmanniomyces endolithicus]|nr:flavodoxin-like fold protein [Friedmanniomyces endolithicus]